MTSKNVSPTATLLRNSRVFSLPPPIRRTRQYDHGLQMRGSEKSTQAAPRYASIETHPSSRCRGDWGLKRPLPLRSTTSSSTPVLRVKAIDSIDHITDFESAADHSLTLQKLQELNIIVSRPVEGPELVWNTPSTPKSVFEDDLSTPGAQSKVAAHPNRWKFDGPWMAGLEEGGFETFLRKSVRRRRKEFRNFLRSWLLGKKKEDMRRESAEEGTALIEESVELTDEEFDTALQRLRSQRDELWSLIWKFLDMPGMTPLESGDLNTHSGGSSWPGSSEFQKGPPSTHPSAGLAYSRSQAYVHNHPVLGPVRFSPPVEARVLKAFNMTMSVPVGIAGVIGMDTKASLFRDGSLGTSEVHGGSKIWTAPSSVHIDAKGRINMAFSRSSPDALAVWENERELSLQEKRERYETPRDEFLARNDLVRQSIEAFRRPQNRLSSSMSANERLLSLDDG